MLMEIIAHLCAAILCAILFGGLVLWATVSTRKIMDKDEEMMNAFLSMYPCVVAVIRNEEGNVCGVLRDYTNIVDEPDGGFYFISAQKLHRLPNSFSHESVTVQNDTELGKILDSWKTDIPYKYIDK